MPRFDSEPKRQPMPSDPVSGTSGSGTQRDADQQIPQEAGQSLKQTASQVASGLKQEGSKIAHEVGKRSADVASTQKNRAAHGIDSIGSALKRAAQNIDKEGNPRLASLVSSAGNTITELASSLERKDFRTIRGELESSARKRPEVFLGLAAVGGFAIGRFLRSSPRREEPSPDRSTEEASSPDWTVNRADIPPDTDDIGQIGTI